jgi:hypothetical protein
MLKRKIFDHAGARVILETKSLLEQVNKALDDAIFVDHEKILGLFKESGWEREKSVAIGLTQRWDAYKEKVVVTVEFSLIDAIQRDFLRALLWNRQGKIDVLVCIVHMEKEPTFNSVRRNIRIFSSILTFPILLIGVQSS